MTKEQIEAVRADLPERLMELADKLTAKHAGLLRHSATAMRDLTKANEELRAEVKQKDEAIKRQAAAVRTLHHNEQTEINQLRAKARDEYRAAATLDSEREMNAILTGELDEARATIDRLTKERDEARRHLSIQAKAYLDLEGKQFDYMNEANGARKCQAIAEADANDLRTRLSAMQAALDALLADTAWSDIERRMILAHVGPFATKPEPEVDPLVEALREIVDPLAYMKARAEQEGAQLSGMAYSIANDAEYLRGIARTALAARGGRVAFDGREG